MEIRPFLESTYLKTAVQAGISEQDNQQVAAALIREAIDEQFAVAMIRPEYVGMAKQMVVDANSRLAVGTVIDFPAGSSAVSEKLAEAEKAIADGADELDFVINYEAFKNEEISIVKDEVLQATKLALDNLKTVKWIIETAALSPTQIIQICALIKNVVLSNFEDDQVNSVFVKSSTGFYETADKSTNGATIANISLMLENAAPLPVKASGGIRNFEQAVEMINLGVKRIGTSSAKAIAEQLESDSNY